MTSNLHPTFAPFLQAAVAIGSNRPLTEAELMEIDMAIHATPCEKPWLQRLTTLKP